MKPGDIRQMFGVPEECQTPIGQARLVRKLGEKDNLEIWIVEYLDDEGHFYSCHIKKEEEIPINIENNEYLNE